MTDEGRRAEEHRKELERQEQIRRDDDEAQRRAALQQAWTDQQRGLPWAPRTL